MTLRSRTLLIAAITVVSLLLVVALVSRRVLLTRFADLEDQEVRRNVERGVSAVSDRLADLSDFAQDYGEWDLTYDFMVSRNPTFVTKDLPAATDQSVVIHFMGLFDTSGALVSGRTLDAARKMNNPFPADIEAYVRTHSVLDTSAQSARGVRGIVVLPDAAALVASWPILTTEGRGPPRGTVVLGRYLDAKEVERLGERTHLPLALVRLDDPAISETRGALLGKTGVAVQATGADSISGYGLLRDPSGGPVAVLRVVMPRQVYREGKAVVAYLLGFILLVGLGFGALILGLLEGMVLSRISRLSASVTEIGARPDLPARVMVSGGDELTTLAEAVNRMLEGLQQSREKLEDILKHSSNLFYSHALDHTITYVSPQTRFFYDCEPEEALVKWTEFTTDHPVNAEGLAHTNRAIETGQPQGPYELELLTRKGRRLWVEVREAPV
ncbi:MAG TPA: CHASE4 domain-containing protein, partial [Vicinamibacteria bacterium]|nr:CHASE4 domain-containing protein [Vicinamibacteria bacterium]